MPDSRNSIRSASRLSGASPVDNHELAVALNMFAYNFCHIHGSLRQTPAMAAGRG